MYEVTLPGGHFGLVVGSSATRLTWPAVAGWVDWRSGKGELPDTIQRAETVEPGNPLRPTAAATAIAQATELGLAAGRVVVTSTRRAARLVTNVSREAPLQLPKLARIQQLNPTTRISLGLLIDEAARRAPKDIAFLFGDRAYRWDDVSRRIDNVVKGLVSIGVRHGDRVGVLMHTRPSAFTLVSALSRLGATAVLLRPDGDFARETALSRVTWMISDPEHAGAGREDRRGDLGRPRRWRPGRPAGATSTRRSSTWSRSTRTRSSCRPGTAPTRTGPATWRSSCSPARAPARRPLHITNRRWALSALGTASAAALKPGDTVYSVTPVHHSSALLMSIGGAVAGGARFAMASADDPNTFWEEVRRYGATHVSYTWTSLRPVVNAPPHPNEQHHPIRMFMGSGMPRNLWRRTNQRFPSTKVLEFYASAEGEAILANVSGRAVGSMGKPLPGTPEVRVAAYDFRAGKLQVSADGFGRECRVDEVGVLLARVDAATPRPTRPCAASSTAATPGARPVTCSCATPRATCGWPDRPPRWCRPPTVRPCRPAPGTHSARSRASTSWSPTGCPRRRAGARRCRDLADGGGAQRK